MALSTKDFKALDSAVQVDSPEGKELQKMIEEIGKEFAECYGNVYEWFENLYLFRFGTLQVLDKIMDRIEEHHRNDQIANTAGSAAGIVGGCLMVGGLVAAPFTAGASLVAVGAGGAISGAGAATSIGADMISGKLIGDEAKSAHRHIENDMAAWEHFVTAVEAVQKKFDQLESKLEKQHRPGGLSAEQITATGLGVGKMMFKIGNMGLGASKAATGVSALSKYGVASLGFGKVSMTALDKLALGHMGLASKVGISLGAKAAKTLVAASGVMAVVGIVADSANLWNTIESLSQKKPHEATKQLQDVKGKLVAQFDSAVQYMEGSIPIHTIMCDARAENGPYLSHNGHQMVDLYREAGGNQKFWICKDDSSGAYFIRTISYARLGPYLSHDGNEHVDLYFEGGGNQLWRIVPVSESSKNKFFIKAANKTSRGPFLSHDGKCSVDLWTEGSGNQIWRIEGFAVA
mmetsp:Transcript_51684/g.109797  ORF Transcript_51684/g.109797 Transcript_51684/m.109797 type:complete len:462 (-) Transcript_51684:458-1843(-)